MKRINKKMKKIEVQGILKKEIETYGKCPLCGYKGCRIKNRRVVCAYCHKTLLRHKEGVVVKEYLDYIDIPTKQAPGFIDKIKKRLPF